MDFTDDNLYPEHKECTFIRIIKRVKVKMLLLLLLLQICIHLPACTPFCAKVLHCLPVVRRRQCSLLRHPCFTPPQFLENSDSSLHKVPVWRSVEQEEKAGGACAAGKSVSLSLQLFLSVAQTHAHIFPLFSTRTHCILKAKRDLHNFNAFISRTQITIWGIHTQA